MQQPPLTSVVCLKDCKEFQGELFGICNLFRDLSDKLFTSELVESHEKGIGDINSAKIDLGDLGIDFDTSHKDRADEHTVRSANDELKHDGKTAVKPVLDDLGEFSSVQLCGDF